MDPKNKIIKNRVYDLVTSSSFHGLPNLLRSRNRFIQVLWIFFFVFSTSMCCYYVYKSLVEYLSFDVNTKMDVIYEIESEFPTISICNPDTPLDNLTVLKCSFNTNNCTSYLETFQEPYFKTYYRFNGKNNSNENILRSTNGGSKYGLQLDLLFYSPNEFNELYLLIHNHSMVTSTLVNKGYHLSSGSIYFFEIQKIFDSKLEFPFNDCYKDLNQFNLNKTLINYLFELKSIYTYKECFRLCRNLYAMEATDCGCMKTYDNAASCSNHLNKTVKACYENFVADFSKSANESYLKCIKFCPYECDSLSYSITAISEHLPISGSIQNTKGFSHSNKFKNFEEVRKYFFSIYIYYEDLKYTIITQQPRSETFNMISNIGGTLGLFIGISFLSFIEIFELIFGVFAILLSNKISI